MKITKLGHCCLLIEENGLRILTDPGNYSSSQDDLRDIDVILITHEHPDHINIESIEKIQLGSPNMQIITNRGVAKLLEKVDYEILEIVEHGQNTKVKNVLIEGFGEKHAEIYPTVSSVVNTGYFIAGRLFYSGDAFYNPGRLVEILALPVAGPWMKISEAIDYAREIRPMFCFPVHDGMLKFLGPVHSLPAKVLTAEGIKFVVIGENETLEL